MKTQDYPRFHFTFVVRRSVFGVRVADQGKNSPIHTSTWLNDMGNKSLLRLIIEILERFAAGLLVL